MSEQTLLVIFIGLVALSLAGIAAVTIGIGVQVYKLLTEVRLIVKKAHAAGDAALADLQALRGAVRAEGMRVWGIADFLISMVSRKVRTSRTKKSEAAEEE